MDFNTPVGRLVQGGMTMRQKTDMDTNQPVVENGQPVMEVFFALAFPKVLPNGQPNVEFDNFRSMYQQVAAAAWPALFPQGPTGPCTHPRFSMKYQDGDGVDQSGKSVAGKEGFAGHHIIKFTTAYPVRCFHEGKFGPHEEIQQVDDTFKRGCWVRVFGEVKTNNASGTQVPGIVFYPKLVSFIDKGVEIKSGPDAQAAFGNAPVGWRPPASASPIPTGGAPAVAAPAVSVPTPAPAVTAPAISVPTPGAAPVVPTPPAAAPAAGPLVSAALAAQGITWAMLQGQGWTEDTARQAGYIV